MHFARLGRGVSVISFMNYDLCTFGTNKDHLIHLTESLINEAMINEDRTADLRIVRECASSELPNCIIVHHETYETIPHRFLRQFGIQHHFI
jgi:hypothetical protein